MANADHIHPRGPAALRGAPAALRRAAGDQAGWSLLETLVTLIFLVALSGALASVLDTTSRQETRNAEYALSLGQERAGLQRMASDIRQAIWVNYPGGGDGINTANWIDMNVTYGGSTVQVYYECDVPQPGTSYRECMRLQAAVGATLPAVSTGTPVVQNLLDGTASDAVMTFSPSLIGPNYVQVRAELPASGYMSTATYASTLHHTIVLDDGVNLRNQSLG